MLSIKNWEQGKVSLFTAHIQHSTRNPRQCSKTKEEARGQKGRAYNWKIIKPSLFTDNCLQRKSQSIYKKAPKINVRLAKSQDTSHHTNINWIST